MIYNLFAYFCFIVSNIIFVLIVVDWIIFPEIFKGNENLIWMFIMLGLTQIYNSIKNKPITEALSKWWEKRNKKSEEQKVENSEIKTYQDYKNHESKK
jgi:hypothetical protein